MQLPFPKKLCLCETCDILFQRSFACETPKLELCCFNLFQRYWLAILFQIYWLALLLLLGAAEEAFPRRCLSSLVSSFAPFTTLAASTIKPLQLSLLPFCLSNLSCNCLPTFCNWGFHLRLLYLAWITFSSLFQSFVQVGRGLGNTIPCFSGLFQGLLELLLLTGFFFFFLVFLVLDCQLAFPFFACPFALAIVCAFSKALAA